MARLRRVIGGFNALFRKHRVEQELDEELRAYLETSVEEKMRAGMARDDAVRAARVEMGSLEAIKDHTRDAGWESALESVWQDVRYALRTLRRAPGFAAVVILTLGLGIGATTAVFSAVDAVVLRALPFDQPDRLVAVGGRLATRPSTAVGSIAPQDFLDWRERQQVFSAIAAFTSSSPTLGEPSSEPELLRAQRVSAEFFDVLRAKPMFGRVFSRDNETEGRHTVAVLSYGTWRGRFGAASDIIGRPITLDGSRYEVVGVLPPDFSYPVAAVEPTQLWVPLVMPPDERIRTPGRFSAYLQGIGRLRDGASVNSASAGMNQIALALEAEHPDWNRDRRVGVLPLHDHVVGARIRSWLLLLLGAALTMMLIVCANLASLSVARASVRDREMATRAAVGAGRWRLVRQLLIESLVLSAIGSTVGVALAWWAVQTLRTTLPENIPRVAAIAVDVRVLVVAITAATVTGLLFGLFPALQSSRPHLTGVLKGSQPGLSPTRGRRQFRSALVVAETALAVILLVGAGLFIRSFQKLMDVDLGFDPGQTLTTTVVVRPGTTAVEAVAPALMQIVNRVRQIPSVHYASAITGTVPLVASASASTTLAMPNQTREDSRILISTLTPDYHRAMRIPLGRGRYLQDVDGAGAPHVVLINETAAERFFPERDPIGRTLPLSGEPRVVGVVGDVRIGGYESGTAAMAYLPLAQRTVPEKAPRASSTFWANRLVIRTASEPLAIVPAVRAAVHSVLPDVPIRDTSTLDDVLGRMAAQRRLSMQLLTVFAALGLVIAVVGIYGLTTYVVARRRHEIGVRMALGASHGQVIAAIMRNAAALVAIGLTLGAAGAWLLRSTAGAFLFQIEPTDIRVFGTAALVLATSAIVASALPAHRAATVDPLSALRQE